MLKLNPLTEKGGVAGLQRTYIDNRDLGSHGYWSIDLDNAYVR